MDTPLLFVGLLTKLTKENRAKEADDTLTPGRAGLVGRRRYYITMLYTFRHFVRRVEFCRARPIIFLRNVASLLLSSVTIGWTGLIPIGWISCTHLTLTF